MDERSGVPYEHDSVSVWDRGDGKSAAELDGARERAELRFAMALARAISIER